MKLSSRIWALGVVFLFGVQYAIAGAPLKGVGVSLGKPPGGGGTARVSSAAGEVNFGVWPRGNYTVSFSTAALAANSRTARVERLHVEIRGGAQGTVTHVLSAADADTLAPIEIVSDGKTPLVVKVSDGGSEPVDWTRVKSHSNSTNN